jgi:ParB family chromosome partitioning protein
MIVKDVPIKDIDVSEFNTRKNLVDGQGDSNIEDLAKSIEKQGLLSPITVFQRSDGKYALIAGQRRLLACKQLNWRTVPAIVRDMMSEVDATAISLVENIHRADMNPLDKARAFKALADKFGSLKNVSRETGVGVQTIRKYIQLLDLAPELQEQLAAGEAKGTQALAQLAQQIGDPDKQREAWREISGYRQDVQQDIISRLDPDLDNLDELIDEADRGVFGVIRVRNCPYDCPTIPEPLKKKVASIIERYNS